MSGHSVAEPSPRPLPSMDMRTVNPATGQQAAVYPDHDDHHVDRILTAVASAFPDWSARSAHDRAEPLWRLAALLRERTEAYATLISTEMGKPHAEAGTEVEKCAWACEHYAEHGAGMLAGEPIEDRKSTRLNSSHVAISYAVFCLKKKKKVT